MNATAIKVFVRSFKVMGLLLIFALLFLSTSCDTNREKKVLVFSKTAAFHHSSIPAGIRAIQELGLKHNFVVDTTTDAGLFNEENLAQYSAIIFLSPTGDVLDHYQQADFERYIQAGGGFVGVHAAADTEYDWPWYNELVGAYFLSHPVQQEARISVLDREHPSTRHLPEEWTHFDEWYNYKSIASGLNVLMNLEESSYEGGTNGENHPIAWNREFDGGRTFYTGLGHTNETFGDELFLDHLLGGIEYAMTNGRLDYTKAHSEQVPKENRFVREVLTYNLNEPMELDYLPDDKIIFIERAGDLKIYDFDTKETILAAHINADWVAEDGLLGLAVDPEYESNHWIYLFYTPKNASKMQRLSRFMLTENVLDFDSEKTLLEVPSTRECCHSGGSLEFDQHGNLYISTGDNTNPFESDGYSPSDERPGRSVWDAQKSSANTNDLRGKIIRIKPEPDGTYSIPPGNLFEDDDPRTRPEIYVMGVRNAFRLAIDQKNGNVYWGDIGPDAGTDNATRGPQGIDEINQARAPGNWGWPYTRGNNIPYWDYDFAKKTPRAPFDPNNLVNNSPNNTGLTNLPPAQESFIWYPYDASAEFPWVGKGGRTAMAGPVFYKNQFERGKGGFPDYYDGKLFIYEWMRDWIFVVTMDENDDFVKAERFLENQAFHNPIDMVFGPDGSLYVLEYGESWNTKNLDAQLNRITYVEGNRPPTAKMLADKTVGPTPLTINFSGDDSFDPDEDNLKYHWVFGEGLGESEERDPVFTFDQKGDFTIQLTVTDEEGLASKAEISITAGNAPPEISISFDSENTFYNRNGELGYKITVEDEEDGSLASGDIQADNVKVSLSFLPEGAKQIVQTGHQVALDIRGKKLIEASDCIACHATDKKINGPSYKDIANRYHEGQASLLASKIKNGGAGVWGDTPMAAHPQLTDMEIEEMVKYILSLKDNTNYLPIEGTLKFDQHDQDNYQGAYILTTSYSDKGSGEAASATTISQHVFHPAILEGEKADEMHSDNTIWNTMNADVIGNVKDGSYLVYHNVLLDKLDAIVFRGAFNANYRYQGNVEIRRGTIDGELMGSTRIDHFDKTRSVFGSSYISLKSQVGRDKLYVIFRNEDDRERFIANADYFLLNYRD